MTACFKCKSGRIFAPSRDGPSKPICADCLCTYLEKLIRDALFRQCALQPDVKLGLCCSGGMSSNMLLSVAGKIRSENLARGGDGKKNFDFVAIHFDERGWVDAGVPEKHFNDLRQFVERCAGAHQIPVIQAKATEVLSPDAIKVVNSSLPLTEREDIYARLRLRALASIAESHGCAKLIIGSNAVQVAVDALSALARGRGAHLVAEAAWVGSVECLSQAHARLFPVLRPMRGILSKEVALYCKAQSIPYSFTPSPATNTSLRSINRTLEAFLSQLMIGFKSSVFCILNTVDRLVQTTVLQDSNSPRGDQHPSAGSPSPAEEGTAVAGSAAGPRICAGCGQPCETESPKYHPSLHPIADVPLCFGCTETWKVLVGSQLPTSVLFPTPDQWRAMTEKEVKAEVAEFLLDQE